MNPPRRQRHCLSGELGRLPLGQVHRAVESVRTALLTPPHRLADDRQLKCIGRTSEALGRREHPRQRTLVGPAAALVHPLARPAQSLEGLLHHGQLFFEHVFKSSGGVRQRSGKIQCAVQTQTWLRSQLSHMPLVDVLTVPTQVFHLWANRRGGEHKLMTHH